MMKILSHKAPLKMYFDRIFHWSDQFQATEVLKSIELVGYQIRTYRVSINSAGNEFGELFLESFRILVL